jgi:hypothetical protein
MHGALLQKPTVHLCDIVLGSAVWLTLNDFTTLIILTQAQRRKYDRLLNGFNACHIQNCHEGGKKKIEIQSDTKKWELLKCIVAAMYSWQHCGTGTFSYIQPRHSVIMDQWNGQKLAFAIKMFYKTMIVWKVRRRFYKSSRFFVSPCISCLGPSHLLLFMCLKKQKTCSCVWLFIPIYYNWQELYECIEHATILVRKY